MHLLHGTQDQDVPVEIAHALLGKMPYAELTLIEGGDHRFKHAQEFGNFVQYT